jgi:TatD DNase family protein
MGRPEPRLWVGLGVHPQLLPELDPAKDDELLEELDGLLAQGGIRAVGECGLDGPSAAKAPMERQLRVFRGHLALARKHRLPILVHCYQAHPAMVEVLKTELLPDAGLVLHSYSGGPELARLYAQRGCYFSFAGPVTYPGARKPLAALREVPRDRLLAETDAPDQAPHPHRGERSEPAYLAHILAAMAQALGLSLEELAHQTTENARSVFRA